MNFYSPGGKPWRSSNVCSDCTTLRRKPKVLTAPKERSEDVEAYLWSAPVYHVSKGCPQCDGPLELSRYFACGACKPEMKSDAMDEFIYMGCEV